jgi:hypothetical protein
VPGSPNRALGFFARGVAAPRDRNEVDLYADSGFTFRGLVPWRPEDMIGLAFAYGRISPDAAAFDSALAASGQRIPIRDYEAAIELTYPGRSFAKAIDKKEYRRLSFRQRPAPAGKLRAVSPPLGRRDGWHPARGFTSVERAAITKIYDGQRVMLLSRRIARHA